MHDMLARLNPEQRQAVTTVDGPLLIIAGAGSGKTGVITTRIAYLIDRGVDPESILALTFTNKAAAEMVERVRELIADRQGSRVAKRVGQALTIGTFHAFGLAILRRYGRTLGYRPAFSVYDEADQLALLKESARELRVDPNELELSSVMNGFSGIKTERIDWRAELWGEMARALPGELTARGVAFFRELYENLQAHLLVYNAVDFDDLIARPLQILTSSESARAHYMERYRYILVDEFQDTSRLQYRLLHELARDTRNLCVVGDDDQSIYSWRGADFTNITAFETDYPERVEITLARNYRSTGSILAAANSVIANNLERKAKELWTQDGEGEQLELVWPDSDHDEAQFIAEKIKLLAYHDGIPYDTFGILTRTNGQARMIEEALLEADVPYRMSGGQSFFQRKEVRDIIAYLRLAVNPDDEISCLRAINTPRRGIGRRTLEQLQELARDQHCSLYSAASLVAHDGVTHTLAKGARESVMEFVELAEVWQTRFAESKDLAATTQRLIDEIDYWAYLVAEFQSAERTAKAKWRNIAFFLQAIERYERNPDVLEPSLEGFLTRISLQARDELSDEPSGAAQLMTIHAAKGLEFDTVFVAGVEDELLPHKRSAEEAGNLEEERRLFYVAITRARRRLFLSSCRRRQLRDEVIDCRPSPFLSEIPEALLSQGSADATRGAVVPEDPFAALRARMGG